MTLINSLALLFALGSLLYGVFLIPRHRQRIWSEAVRETRAIVAREIAYDIRAELVCCDIYDQLAGTTAAEHVHRTEHSICFWGEAGARIAEDHVHEDWEDRKYGGDDETYETATGKELSPEEIERLAAEAEAGYDIDSMKPRPRRRAVTDD
jgi:hypothetical protein